MGDGLEWLLEIETKADGLTALLKDLEGVDKLQVKVTSSSEKASEGHKKHAKGAEEATGALQRLVSAGIDPLLHKAKEIGEFEFIRRGMDALIDAPMEIAEKLKELGEEAVTTAAKMERTEKSFGFLFGHEGGDEMLEYIEKIGGATEFTRDRLRGAALDLAKVGFSGEGLKRAFGASIDMAALNPDKASGLSDSLFALEQAKRTGMVNNRTLRATGIGEDTFFKALSDRTGEDIKSLKKKMSAGKVDADDALETLYASIAKKTGKDFLGGAGIEMGKTLEAKMTHLGELPERFFEKLRHTDAFDDLSAAAGRFLTMLDPESPTGGKIFDALKGGFKGVGDAIKSIDAKEVGDDLAKLAGLVKPTVGVMRELANAVIDAGHGFKVLGGLIHDFTPAGFFYDVGKARQAQIEKHGGLGAEIEGALGTTGDTRPWYDKYTPAGFLPGHGRKAIGEEAAAALRANDFEGAGAKAGADFVKGARGPKGTDSHSPSKKFRDIGEDAREGFEGGYSSDGAFAAPSPRAGRSGGTSTPISVSCGDINIELAPGASPGEHAHAVRVAVQAEMIDFAERMRAKMGN